MNTIKEHTKEQPNCEYCGGDGIYIDNDSNRLKCPMCENGKSLTFEQPQSVDNTIDVEEIYPSCLHPLLDKKASENNTIDLNAYAIGLLDCYKYFYSQPKAIEDNVWYEIYKHFPITWETPSVQQIINHIKQHYSLIRK